MKKIIISIGVCITSLNHVFSQNNQPILDAKPTNAESLPTASVSDVILPILFISFLIFMLTCVVKYFLDYRLKNKLINHGMSEQLSAHLLAQYGKNKLDDVIKWAILFCGIGAGLIFTYITGPINIHSLAIMAFSLGLSYLAYFFYLRR